MKHIGISYSDVMNMSVYERRFYLQQLINEKKRDQESVENAKNNSSSSNGRRVTTISGEQLKAKLKSGEIPNT